jgi:hypothetical protein
MIFCQVRRSPQCENRLARTNSNNCLVFQTFVRAVIFCECRNLGVTLHDPGVTLHYLRFRKNCCWWRDTHVLSTWRDDTTACNYLLIEVMVLHYHFHLLPHSCLPPSGSRQDNSVNSPISRTCSGTSEGSGCGLGLLQLPPLILGQFGFRHFDPRKNGKSNVNKL